MLALPGTGKSFETFQIDDSGCRGYATVQTGGVDANQAAADSTVRSAALGTVIGAVAGAAIGGNSFGGKVLAGTVVGTFAQTLGTFLQNGYTASVATLDGQPTVRRR